MGERPLARIGRGKRPTREQTATTAMPYADVAHAIPEETVGARSWGKRWRGNTGKRRMERTTEAESPGLILRRRRADEQPGLRPMIQRQATAPAVRRPVVASGRDMIHLRMPTPGQTGPAH